MPKALPVAVLDDLEKATGRGRGRERTAAEWKRGESALAWAGEKERELEKREVGEGRIHLIKMEKHEARAAQTKNAIYGLPRRPLS